MGGRYIGIIYFKSSKALMHLIRHGRVFTLRKHRKKTIFCFVHNGKKKTNLFVSVILKKVIRWNTVEDLATSLEPFVKHSGFKDAYEWIEELKKLNRGRIPKKLYLHECVLQGNYQPKR